MQARFPQLPFHVFNQWHWDCTTGKLCWGWMFLHMSACVFALKFFHAGTVCGYEWSQHISESLAHHLDLRDVCGNLPGWSNETYWIKKLFGNSLEVLFNNVTIISLVDEQFLPLAGNNSRLPHSEFLPPVTVSVLTGKEQASLRVGKVS